MQKEQQLLTQLEGMRNFSKEHYFFWITSAIALGWSLFQLFIVLAPITNDIIRSVHIAFAIFLTFLFYPICKKEKLLQTIPWYDFILAFLSALAMLYVAIFYQELSMRPGAYTTTDVVVALFGIVILLEAGRRSLGLALSVIAIVFIIYDLFGRYFPDLIIHKGASLNKLAGHLFLTSEGIFGVSLGVSAGFIFLFVLFGALIDKAGAGKYFIDLSYSLLGTLRGGPAKASVMASGFTGIMSGSSIANTVTTGTFTIPLMKKTGFPPEKAAAVEVAASTNGQLMPPVMGAAAFIIAEFLGLAYSDVILAAFIPAFVSYFGLFYIVHLESLKLGLKGANRSELPQFIKTFVGGIHFIIPILFLLYSLLIARQSTALAAYNAIMFLLLIMATQHPIKALLTKTPLTKEIFLQGFYDILNGFISGAKNAIPIAIATGIAGIVIGSITLTGLGQVLAEVIEAIAGNEIILILILAAITSLILGMGLPTTANYIVMASLTAPVILILAADNGYIVPAIAAHLFVFYFGILADDTPPVGLAAYAASGIAKSDPIRTGIQGFSYDIRTAILPFMFFFNPELVLIESVTVPTDPSTWVWITDPIKIAMLFITAIIGMFAFSCFTQNYFIRRNNIFESLLFLTIVPLMFLPNIVAPAMGLENENVCYLLGMGIYLFIYLLQKRKG